MTIINGLAITDNMVNTLKKQIQCKGSTETSFDGHIKELMNVNDYFIDSMFYVGQDDIEKLKIISGHLEWLKAIRDMLGEINNALKESIELTN